MRSTETSHHDKQRALDFTSRRISKVLPGRYRVAT